MNRGAGIPAGIPAEISDTDLRLKIYDEDGPAARARFCANS